MTRHVFVRSAIAVLAVGWLAALVPGVAHAQATYFYRGGNRTWSNTNFTDWWTTYAGSTNPTQATTINDTAVFNGSGLNTTGTVNFTGDASIRGLLVLQTATGALTLKGDGVANRTLTIGAGGIRTLTGNASAMTIGSVTANQGLNIQLGANQEWRRRTGSVTVNNNITGTTAAGTARTLVISTPLANSTISGTVSDAAGGKTNLWLTGSTLVTVGTASIASTGTLTVQTTRYTTANTGAGFQFSGVASGTLASIQALQFVGGGFYGNGQGYTLSGSNTVSFLGGSADMGWSIAVNQTGTISRPVGGGFLAVSGGNMRGVANDINLNGVVPWAVSVNSSDFTIPLYFASGTLVAHSRLTNSAGFRIFSNGSPYTLLTDSGTNYDMSNLAYAAGPAVPGSNGAVQYVPSTLAGSLICRIPNYIFDLNANTFTANAFLQQSSFTLASSGGGGGVVIGPSGELIIMQANGGVATISAPIRESVAKSWVTYGAVDHPYSRGTGLLVLSGSNSHTGGTSLVGGSTSINNAYALGSGTFRINGQAIVLDNTTSGPLTIATNNYNQWNTDFAFQGTQDLNLGTGTVSLGAYAGSTRTVTVNAGNLTVGGPIVDGSFADLPTNSIAKDGNGTLILSGSNNYSGATEVWGGELRFANRNALYNADTSKWTAANLVTGTGAILSVSVGNQSGAFTSSDLDTLAGAVGGVDGGYLGIDTTGQTSGTFTYATNLANPSNGNLLGIAKTGVGTLVLSGNNTFTGGVLVRQGTLRVTAASQIGTGTAVAAGGLLDMTGQTVTNPFSIQSGTIANLSINASNLTANVTGPAVFSGTLTGNTTTGTLTKTGTGTLVLSAVNTYTGTTTLSGGLLSISSDANIGGTSAPLTFNGGGLQVTGVSLTSLNTNRTTTFTSGVTATFDIADPANSFTVSQPLNQGTGGLTKSGSGTLVLTNANNTYTGATTIAGGTLRMGASNTSAIGAGTVLTTSGGVLDLNGNSISRSGLVTIAGGGVTNGTLTFTGSNVAGQSGVVSANLVGTGTFGLTKSGTGVLVLSGSNSYAGLTTVSGSGGILQFATPNSLYGGATGSWTKTNITVNSAATLAVNVGGAGDFQPTDVTTLLSGIGGALSGNGLLAGASIGFDTTNSGTTFTVGDLIADTTNSGTWTGAGAVGLVKLGSGTLALSGANTYTGQTVIGTSGGPNAGTLQLAGSGAVSATVVVYGGAFDLNGQNRSVTNLFLGGGAAGSSAGVQTGNGTLTIGTGGVTYVNLPAANGATISGSISLGSASRTFVVNDSPAAAVDLAVSAAITSGTLVKTGFGTLGLTGTSSFAGRLQVAAGAVQINWINDSGNSPLGSNTTTDLGTGSVTGTLSWTGTTNGSTSRVLNLSGSTGGATLDASGVGALVITSTVTAAVGSKTLMLGGTSTAANEIRSINNPTTGNASVVKDGPGLWRLTGTSGFAGGVTVKNGTIVAGVDTNGGTDAGVFGTSDTVIVGDESSGAAGTASLLLAPGVVFNKLLRVPATTGTQTVVLGGEASGATPRFENQIQLGRNVALVAATGGTTSFGNTWLSTGTAPLSANVSIGSAGRAGAVRLANDLATTGSVAVRFGTLDVLVARTLTAAGIVGIDSGATLAGVGRVAATLGGAGLVAPGNSPGILTADAVDPTGGLDWAFEFSGTAPTYGSGTASVNDVLRLTGTASAPFTTALTSANEIAVYLDVASLAEGNTFSGGFFTNLAGDFRSSIAGAAYTYWVSGTGAGQTTYQSKTYVPLATAYPSLSMDVTTVATSATFFGESQMSGQVTQFTVVVPEPGTLALAALGLGLAGYALRRRRHQARSGSDGAP